VALSQASEEVLTMRDGYLPLQVKLKEVLEDQESGTRS